MLVELNRREGLPDMMAAAIMSLLLAAGIWVSQGRSAGLLPVHGTATRFSEAARPPANLPAPPVEPVRYAEIAPEDAVTINAGIPFAGGPNPAARPFRLGLGTEDIARSVDCLASAVHYEAATEGDDGMRAVAQVVINRLRHPAFPKTICGVVFQGSERSTGCQFTFTCDGALARTPAAARWTRAQEIATAALKGKVFKPVGHSTHYHTNWVVPYWSGSLDKVAQIGTHLFFRWEGWWGTPGAFRGGHGGSEASISKLAALSPAHASAAAGQLADADKSFTDAELADRGAKQLKIVSPGGDAFVVVLDRSVPASRYPALALAACGSKEFCKFMGWTDARQAPKGFPIGDAEHKALSFSYLRNKSNGFEKMLWNCKEFARSDPTQCMKTL